MDRPNTPGSHIDWAGDDDDSLPDLDDWGVTSSTAGTADHPSSTGASRIISPILEDTLKPLPSLDNFGSHFSSTSDEHAPDADEDTHDPIRAHQTEEKMVDSSSAAAEVGSSKFSDSSLVPNDSSASTSPPKSTSKVPLHPSLPPRPVGAFELTSKANTRRTEPSQKGKAAEVHSRSHAQVLPPVRISLDGPNGSSNDSSPERSLASSMHAIPTSHSAPSDVTAHAIPAPYPRNHFNPTHNRAHTVGARVPGLRQPFTAPNASFPDHVSSDGERPRRGDHAHHARTQSTPPTGPGTHGRAPHATRPVITVDAISKLARTLGQTPLRHEAGAAQE